MQSSFPSWHINFKHLLWKETFCIDGTMQGFHSYIFLLHGIAESITSQEHFPRYQSLASFIHVSMQLLSRLGIPKTAFLFLGNQKDCTLKEPCHNSSHKLPKWLHSEVKQWPKVWIWMPFYAVNEPYTKVFVLQVRQMDKLDIKGNIGKINWTWPKPKSGVKRLDIRGRVRSLGALLFGSLRNSNLFT